MEAYLQAAGHLWEPAVSDDGSYPPGRPATEDLTGPVKARLKSTRHKQIPVNAQCPNDNLLACVLHARYIP